MTNVTKIAPMREGLMEEVRQIEERMHYLIGRIAEYERVIRHAKELESKLGSARAELANMTAEYRELLTKGAESWAG